MKKITKRMMYICLILLLIGSAAAGITACDKPEERVETPNVLLNGFEDWARDFEGSRVSSSFGSVEMNEDMAFVTEGERSAGLRILRNSTKHTWSLPLSSARFDWSFRDLTGYDAFTLEAYNAEDFEIAVEPSFMFRNSGELPSGKPLALKPGWNSLSVPVSHEVANLFYDVTDYLFLCLNFKLAPPDGTAAPAANMQGGTYAEVYLDELTLVPAKVIYEPLPNAITLAPYEICSFERVYQQYVFLGGSNTGDWDAVLSVVGASGGVTPTQGSKMLQIVYPGRGSAELRKSNTWSFVRHSPKLKDAVNYAQYKAEAEKYMFCADVYNASAAAQVLVTDFSWAAEGATPEWNMTRADVKTTLRPNQWTTVEFPLSTVGAGLDNGLTFAFQVIDEAAADRTVYVDHIRILKVY